MCLFMAKGLSIATSIHMTEISQLNENFSSEAPQFLMFTHFKQNKMMSDTSKFDTFMYDNHNSEII